MNLPKWIYSEELTYRKEIKRVLGIKFAFPRVKKTIAFVETQGLGDYILIHNFFKYIKQSKKYKDYNIILIARNNIASLAEAYDSMYINEFLYVDTRSAKKILKDLKVEELVCAYNGLGKFERWIFDNVKAKRKIVHGDKNKKADVCIYTPNENLFHRERMKKFYEQLIEEKISCDNLPYFKNEFEKISGKCIFISPFANDIKRTWSLDNYVSLIKELCKNYSQDIVILGEASQYKQIEDMISSCGEYENRIINTAGMFSVKALYDVIKEHADLLIGNETGTIHIAMAAKVKAVCISNGSFYGIYQPYDDKKIRYVYPSCFERKYTNLSNLDINLININDVYDTVNDLLNDTSFV